MDYEPPLLEASQKLLRRSSDTRTMNSKSTTSSILSTAVESSTCELPVIDLGRLNSNTDHLEREECKKQIIEAAKQWGFFQLVNHGISQQFSQMLLSSEGLIKAFHRPFADKSQQSSTTVHYKWGNPFATNLKQLLWSEAFHIFFPHGQANMDEDDHHTCLRSITEAFVRKVAPLAESLAEILGQELNIKSSYFREMCLPNTSFLRLNRYPPCPIPKLVFGLLPHTDSTFLSIVYQGQVEGLQLLRDGKWIGVKPNPHVLLVNVGDLFEALSNGVYRSIIHRVVAAEKEERFSVAYFYRPFDDAVIESHGTPRVYRSFTFKEYKQQNEEALKQTGNKVGLSRLLFVEER
ncbi:gibberellin 2-beta-dioxygenase 8-like [Prosopis cineraria]|uniref:gibberellin 2-beta-dioxygenase 8-like n=1 Tax=Prosopis cineraria TaxID=364024 RepID=UPI0024100836|nr:gibberellin 2-beta-dioxygenase 8-like [Prosopis cineraria]XP_054794097.1 gibberellin 2-beta-dioxygenase 8-like [Prosopis cineraria]